MLVAAVGVAHGVGSASMSKACCDLARDDHVVGHLRVAVGRRAAIGVRSRSRLRRSNWRRRSCAILQSRDVDALGHGQPPGQLVAFDRLERRAPCGRRPTRRPSSYSASPTNAGMPGALGPRNFAATEPIEGYPPPSLPSSVRRASGLPACIVIGV